MKSEYVLPAEDEVRINKLNKTIHEIEQDYIELAEKRPFVIPDLQKRFRSDWRIKALEKSVSHIYKVSVGTYVVEAENEEEMKMLQERFLNGGKTNVSC